MSDGTRASAYPAVFNILLLAIVPICFVIGTLALISALPIGELAFRIGAAGAIALLPLLLAYRASSALARRRVRGLLRAPVAIALVFVGYAAIIGGLHEWRGLQPPHLIAVADHLHRVYLLGEAPTPLMVVEPKPPLHELYDRRLEPPPADEHTLAIESKPGLQAIEIWSTEGDFRARFLGAAAGVDRLSFLDEHRLLAVRPSGRALLIDAEKGGLLRLFTPPEPLANVVVQTSTRALVIGGKVESTGESLIHYYDLDSGELRISLRSKTYVAFSVTADLRRALIVDRSKKGEMMLVPYHLPSGEIEANIPKAALTNPKGRKLKEVSGVVAIGGGEHVVIFEGNHAQLWDVMKKKPIAFPLAQTKIYGYGIAPGGHAYFHRRTDAGDPNPTGLYRLPGGEKLIELETRGQPPRAFFAEDGGSVAVGPVVISTANGKVIGGQLPESFSLERESYTVPARDGSAFLMPDGKERLAVKNAKLASSGVVPVRGENPGAISVGGKLYAVSTTYAHDQWIAVLKDLDEWRPAL